VWSKRIKKAGDNPAILALGAVIAVMVALTTVKEFFTSTAPWLATMFSPAILRIIGLVALLAAAAATGIAAYFLQLAAVEERAHRRVHPRLHDIDNELALEDELRHQGEHEALNRRRKTWALLGILLMIISVALTLLVGNP
jgi:hypothetical protein